MKKWVMVLVLLYLPGVLAQSDTYNNYSSLTLDINLEASARTLFGENPRLDELVAKIYFYPRDEFPNQVIQSQEISTTPEAEFQRIDGDDEYIRVAWRDTEEDSYRYGISTRIKTLNYIPEIKTKIPFPIDLNDPFIDAEAKKYVGATEFITITDEIKNKASEIIEGQTDYYLVVYKLADWVQENIKYNLTTLTAEAVQNSSWVLENKEGVCDEITNLFISLARSLGIPARFISGQVYTNIDKNFGNHGWAEVFFPGYGWIPVDVTFGQYGWVDPSHVKYGARIDPGLPSIEYSWLARNIEFKFNPLSTTTEIIEKIPSVPQKALLDMDILRNNVAPGSFIPLHVRVKNPHDYYLPITIRVAKAPGLVERNWEPLLIPPLEERSVFWIVKVPEEAEKDFIYSTTLEAQGTFGETVSETLSYALGNQQYSLEWAEDQVELLEPREEKAFFPGMDLKCEAQEPYYYRKDTVNMHCILQNGGNTKFDNINVCYEVSCKTIDLLIGESREVALSFPAAKVTGDQIRVSAESANLVKHAYPSVKIIEVPEVTVDHFSPAKIPYESIANLSFMLEASVPIHNVGAEIEGVGKVFFKDYAGRRNILIPFHAKNLARGKVLLDISYEDDAGKRYTLQKIYGIEVQEIPLFWRFIFWLESFFSN
ncbi:transglutaminase domain-containing protein [Candidatus Woesearchaeota archaeon]|nr:transglutaminase domain-containing protein [Candidatus Woesearchaeota archaeon]